MTEAGHYTLGQLAGVLDVEYRGNPDTRLTGLGTVESAGPGDICFVANPRYKKYLAQSGASAAIVSPRLLDACPMPALLSDQPYQCFARVSQLFNNRPQPPAEVHPSATIDPSVRLGSGVSVGPNVVIEANVSVGEGAVVGANTCIGADCDIGAGCWLFANVTLYHDVHLGAGCTVHSGAVIGADGFGFAPSSQAWLPIAQVGGVRIGTGTSIGANTSIDRGAIEHTLIGSNVIIDNLVQIAHNCEVGDNTAIAGCTGIAGSSKIGANCVLGGGVGMVGHLALCDGVTVTGWSMITRSITEPGSYSGGLPMQDSRSWRRTAARFAQLDELANRLQALERKID